MADVMWLPPINSGGDLQTDVFIRQVSHGSHKRARHGPVFRVKLVAEVDYACNGQGKEWSAGIFKGLDISTQFQIPFEDVSAERIQTEIHNRTSLRMCGRIYLSEDHLGDTNDDEDDEIEAGDLYERLANFLCVSTEKAYNRGATTIDLRLYIARDYFLPRDELESWNAWYEEKKQADPRFEDAYDMAISRPRSEAEEARASVNENEEDELLVLEEVRFSDLGSCTCCSICFDDFVPESKPRKLECEHVFDEHCIRKWLRQVNVCPLCRFNE